MKRWMPMMIMSGLLVSLPIHVVRADEGGPAAEMQGKGMHEGFGRWHDGLDLNEDQKSKLHNLREEERKALKPLFRKLRDLRMKLHDQIEDKAGDSDIKSTLGEMKSGHKALKEQMEKFESQKDSILTPTQQAKMMLMHGRHKGMRDGGN